MGWICTKCSLQFENRSIFNKHFSSIEHVESGYTKEEPTSKISQLPTLTISHVPKKTENLYNTNILVGDTNFHTVSFD